MSDSLSNRVIELAKRPKGKPDKEAFRFRNLSIPEPEKDEILLKTLYISVDPYMLGRMQDGESYIDPFPLGAPIIGGVVAEILESKTQRFSRGEIVQGWLEWKEYQIAGKEAQQELQIVDPELAPISTSLSTLGLTGLTAYFGLIEVGELKQGDTVMVSGAAGAVGSVVVQIAKLKGCKVIGTAGSDQKIDYLEKELGADKGINYKKTNDLEKDLREACPDGIDVYFDNVGGELSSAVIPLINKYARIVLCGQISLYDKEEPPVGPLPQPVILTKSAKMEGFIVGNFENRFEEGINQLAQWYQQGKLKHRETVTEGFENVPNALMGLFKGENIGKQIVKISEPES